MSPEEREALRRAAEEATPGPWRETSFSQVWTVSTLDTGAWWIADTSEKDAAFIAATDPPTVLALLDEVARLSAALEVAREVLDEYGHERTCATYISTGDLPCDCPISDALARIDKEAPPRDRHVPHRRRLPQVPRPSDTTRRPYPPPGPGYPA